jgi:predicted nucleotidyltransferase
MEEERVFLDELTARLRAILGDELMGVYAGGSFALGGYEQGRSDLDLAVVVRKPLAKRLAEQIIAAVRHDVLPSPARKLELVVYGLEAASSRSVEPHFELNLNSGPGEFRADLKPQPGESHWFAIDRSILAKHGVALFGPPAGEVFVSPPREDLLPILAEAVRWYLREEPESEDALLNAGRALRFAREGVWAPKPMLREWAQQGAGSRREVLERAIEELEDVN